MKIFMFDLYLLCNPSLLEALLLSVKQVVGAQSCDLLLTVGRHCLFSIFLCVCVCVWGVSRRHHLNLLISVVMSHYCVVLLYKVRACVHASVHVLPYSKSGVYF